MTAAKTQVPVPTATPIVGVGLAMLISGTANVVANWNDINGVWHGLSMFGVGAASAGLSIAGYPFLGAMLMGSGNSILNQGFNNGWNNINTDAVLASTGMSLVTYGIGNQIGLKYDNIVTKVTKGIDNEVLRAGAHDALSGFLGGFSWGSGISLLSGENWGDALLEGFKYGSQGAIFNGLNGLNRGYISTNPKTLSPQQKGKLGVQKAEREFVKEGGAIIGHEVTIEIDGIRVRPDLIGEKDGVLYIIEVKNGPNAGLTKNQRIVYPKLENGKTPFIPRGGNATKIPQFSKLVPSGNPYIGNYKFLTIRYK